MAGGPGDDDCSRQQDSLVLPLVERQVVLDEHPGDVVREVVRSPFTDIPADLPPDTVASLRRRLDGHLLSDSSSRPTCSSSCSTP